MTIETPIKLNRSDNKYGKNKTVKQGENIQKAWSKNYIKKKVFRLLLCGYQCVTMGPEAPSDGSEISKGKR
jgi:hypothetical protein